MTQRPKLGLSRRQQQVYELDAQGLPVEKIAKLLNLSENSIRSYLKRADRRVHHYGVSITSREYFQGDPEQPPPSKHSHLVPLSLLDVLYAPDHGAARPSRPPGLFLQSVADFLCSQKTFKTVVTPLIADMQYEHFEAISQGRTAKAFYIRVRYWWGFLKVLGLDKVIQSVAEWFLRPST